MKDLVKGPLKILGHALTVAVHERLDHVDHALDVIIEQNNSMARAQTALLQASIYTVNSLRTDLAAIRAQVSALARAAEEEMVRQVAVETDDYGFANPKAGLIAHLYSFLPSRNAVDVGAHVGEVSARMIEAGYEVYAFEPFQPVYEKLAARLAAEPRFHGFACALGSEEGEARLHLARDLSGARRYDDATLYNSLFEHPMPEDLPFADTVAAPVRTLAALVGDGSLPEEIGLVKISAEGHDLEVIRGMGEHQYPVVSVGYWDKGMPFGGSEAIPTVDTLIGEMRVRGYGWHLVVYRIWGRNQTAFYSNHARAVPHSWGDVFFFRDYTVFTEAQAWCAAVLPRTFFKPAPGA